MIIYEKGSHDKGSGIDRPSDSASGSPTFSKTTPIYLHRPEI